MELTKEKLLQSRIIFNHVPKTGGTSLIHLFREIFGRELCFRHRVRNAKSKTISPGINSVPPKKLETYRLVAGHWNFGNHTRFTSPSLYVGIMRDPLDRVVSAYYYARTLGREDQKELTNRLSLEEYILEKMKQPKNLLVASSQIIYLSGKQTAAEAIGIIEKWYLACCTNEQLEDMQRMLVRLYDCPDLAPMRTNVTPRKKDNTGLSAETVAKMNERFEEDYKLLSWVYEKFDREYRVQSF